MQNPIKKLFRDFIFPLCKQLYNRRLRNNRNTHYCILSWHTKNSLKKWRNYKENGRLLKAVLVNTLLSFYSEAVIQHTPWPKCYVVPRFHKCHWIANHMQDSQEGQKRPDANLLKNEMNFLERLRDTIL